MIKRKYFILNEKDQGCVQSPVNEVKDQWMENFDQSTGMMYKEILELTKLHSSCSGNYFKLGRHAWVKRGQKGMGG